MSASDNLSAKCSGLLLQSSFAILAARARQERDRGGVGRVLINISGKPGSEPTSPNDMTHNGSQPSAMYAIQPQNLRILAQ